MLRYPIIALVIGWILGAVFTKLLLPYLEKKQFKQFVREVGPQSHLSKTGTPSMGGLAIIGASVLASAGVGLAAGVADGWHLVVILLIMVLFGCIGFIDDYEKAIKKNNAGISPKQKIILQFVFSGAFAIYAYLYSGFGTVPGSAVWIPFVDRYIDFGLLYIPFIIFVMIAFSNAVNLTDGLDGLASGVTALVAFCMVILGVGAYPMITAAPIVYGAVAGACLGFLMYNKNPARIFMGDTGAAFLGYILATLSVTGLFKMYAIISFAVPFLILGVPIFDICFAFLRRIAKGQNPMKADRGHVHHRLIDMGFSQKQAVAISYMLAAILGLAAVLLTSSGELKALILIGTIFVVGAIGMRVIFGTQEPAQKSSSGQDESAKSEDPSSASQEEPHA